MGLVAVRVDVVDRAAVGEVQVVHRASWVPDQVACWPERAGAVFYSHSLIVVERSLRGGEI